MSGWIGLSRLGCEESSLDPEYSRVTNPERFRPLHATMLKIIDRLENDFDVERTEGYGLNKDLRRGSDLARPDVKLVPKNPGAAPIVAAFSTFPGLFIRFGRWYIQSFPRCGCDACNESAEGEIERLNVIVDDVTAGRFRETIATPLMSFIGSGWQEAEFWSPGKRRSRSRSGVDGFRARKMSGGRRRLDLNWQPWPRRWL